MSPACKGFSKSYRNLGKLMNGFFRLAVVDSSTEDGQHIFKKLKLFDARNHAEDPALYTISPFDNAASPFDNSESHPQQFMGNVHDTAKLGQHLFDLLNKLVTKRHEALGLDGGKRGEKPKPKKKSGEPVVVELNESNFDTHVLQNRNVVAVAFTAPWCGHCTKLKPEWQEAAEALDGEGVVLGWVDATANRQLAATFEVQSYPTIKVFPAGTPKTPTMAEDYRGPREAEGIVQTLLLEVEKAGITKEILELTDPETMEDSCGGRNHICVLAVLPHILDSGAAGRNKYRDLLAEVSKSFRGTSFSFLWFEVGSQTDLEQKLELTFGAPALVAYSMDRKAYAVLRGSFSHKSVTSFLHSITTGRQPTIQLSELPTVFTTDPWNGEDAPPVEDDIPLSEIMGDDEF